MRGRPGPGRRSPPHQVARLDAASATTPPYPYFPYHRQEGFARLSPPLISRARSGCGDRS
ncbi:MAG: hypothetical protein GEV28_30830 [Actinophytocola sp.]|nr:hypothetical protein [Actinophytocola sp.]